MASTSKGPEAGYDVLISSPPYSADHLERCLRFCCESGKPWVLLLPNWVARKDYYEQIVPQAPKGGTAPGQPSRATAAATASAQKGFAAPFYLAPTTRYTYWMPSDLVAGESRPEWVGKDGGTSPYHSTWYILIRKRRPPHPTSVCFFSCV